MMKSNNNNKRRNLVVRGSSSITSVSQCSMTFESHTASTIVGTHSRRRDRYSNTCYIINTQNNSNTIETNKNDSYDADYDGMSQQSLLQYDRSHHHYYRPNRQRCAMYGWVTIAVITFLMIRSEAFASSSQRSSIFGKRLYPYSNLPNQLHPFVTNVRGGDNGSTGGGIGSSSSRTHRNDITCVLQVPPPHVNGYSIKRGSDNNKNRGDDAKNGWVDPNKSKQTACNGSSASASSSTSSSTFTTTTMSTTANGNNQGQTPGSITPVQFVAETKLPTEIGQFKLRAYRIPGSPVGYREPCVIYYSDKPPFGGANNNKDEGSSTMVGNAIPVRIHDQCITSEVFGSQRCDCKEQLNMALKYIKKHGGLVIYLQQEGRGIGLANKIAAYSLQDFGLDTVDANLHLGFPDDAREYSVVPSILKDLQISEIALMTNNPRKTKMLTELGVNIVQTLPMVIPQMNPYNRRYMETKVNRMDHKNMAQLLLSQQQLQQQQESDSEDDTETKNNDYDNNNRKQTSAGTAAQKLAIANGMMSPRFLKHVSGGSQTLPGEEAPSQRLAEWESDKIGNSNSSDNNNESVVNDNIAMPANAIQVSLEVLDSDDNEMDSVKEITGIEAQEDGYCLGKQTVLDAIAAIKRGEMIVVVDDLDRENEGDFIMAADMCTDLDMAKIIRYSSGVVCIGMEAERMEQLKLPPMVTNNEDPKGTAFSVSVDATKEHGITTGISATDRSITIQLLANPSSKATDFHRPGHIFPLRACSGGVLERNGHTEAAVDFAKLAGLNPAGVLCEIVSEENPTEMMRLPEIRRFCHRHQFVLTSIADLIQYRKELALEQQEQQQTVNATTSTTSSSVNGAKNQNE